MLQQNVQLDGDGAGGESLPVWPAVINPTVDF